MPVTRKPTGAYDAASPITLADGTSVFAIAAVLANEAGDAIGTQANPLYVSGGSAGSSVSGTNPDGAAQTGNPVRIAGSDSGNIVRTILTGTGGAMVIGSNASGSTAGVAATSTDSVSPTTTGLATRAFGYYYDPVALTMQRMRGDMNGAFSVEKNRAQWWNEAPSQTLAASATFTTQFRDSGVVSGGIAPYSRFGAFILASQPGTLIIVGSDDMASVYTVANQPVAAGVALDVSIPARTRYHRVSFVNGATIQSSLRINSGYQS